MPHIDSRSGEGVRSPPSAFELAVADAVRSATNHEVCISMFSASVRRSRECADPACRPQVSETEPASLEMHWLAGSKPPYAIFCQSSPSVRGPACVADGDTLGHAIRLRLCRRDIIRQACLGDGFAVRHAVRGRDTILQACVGGASSERRLRRRGGDWAGHARGLGLGGGVAPWHQSRRVASRQTRGLPLRSAQRRRHRRETGARHCEGALPHLRRFCRQVR